MMWHAQCDIPTGPTGDVKKGDAKACARFFLSAVRAQEFVGMKHACISFLSRVDGR